MKRRTPLRRTPLDVFASSVSHLITATDTNSRGEAPANPMHIEDITRAALSRLQQEASNMSDDMIERCLEMLTRTSSDLREAANARVPLCALPVEVLNQIMEAIPEPLECSSTKQVCFVPFWRSAAKDSTMLVPIISTCRYLRKVAMSNALLWTTVTTESTSSLSQARLCDNVPMAVVVTPSKNLTNILDTFYPSHSSHVRELHFTEIGHRQINYVQSLMKFSSPALTSYAFCGKMGDLLKWPTHALPLFPASTSSLRDLYIKGVPLLPSSSLPHLTHLALCFIEMPDLHIAIANLLSHCPNLEALVLSNLFQTDNTTVPDTEPIVMKQLRRITLHSLLPALLRFYLTLLPWAQSQSATQILLNAPAALVASAWMSRSIFEGAAILALTHFQPLGSAGWHSVGLTTVTPDYVAHVVHSDLLQLPPHPTYSTGDWYAEFALYATALSSVREVWVTNVRRGRDHEFPVLQSLIASLPALETLILTDNSHAGYTSPLSADLSMCPGALDPTFQSHRLKTLRLAFGLPPISSSTYTYVLYALSLTDMLAQLKTGAYDYFDHLIVQVVPQLVISEADRLQLWDHFSTVRIERIDVLPEVPLPTYCTEPKAGPRRNRVEWRGALW